MSKTNKPNHMEPTDLVAAIERKRDSLRAEAVKLQTEARDLRARGIRPVTAGEMRAAERAQQILAGLAPLVASTSPSARLADIELELSAIDLAISFLESAETENRVVLVAKVMQETVGGWADIVRRRSLALAALRNANADAVRFIEMIKARTKVLPSLRCNRTGGKIFGPRQSGDEIEQFLKEAVECGFVTEKEIANAR